MIDENTRSFAEGMADGAEFRKEKPNLSLAGVKNNYTRFFEMPFIAKADRERRSHETGDHKAGFIRGYFA